MLWEHNKRLAKMWLRIKEKTSYNTLKILYYNERSKSYNMKIYGNTAINSKSFNKLNCCINKAFTEGNLTMANHSTIKEHKVVLEYIPNSYFYSIVKEDKVALCARAEFSFLRGSRLNYFICLEFTGDYDL